MVPGIQKHVPRDRFFFALGRETGLVLVLAVASAFLPLG